jgi:hypothetical protein
MLTGALIQIIYFLHIVRQIWLLNLSPVCAQLISELSFSFSLLLALPALSNRPIDLGYPGVLLMDLIF